MYLCMERFGPCNYAQFVCGNNHVFACARAKCTCVRAHTEHIPPPLPPPPHTHSLHRDISLKMSKCMRIHLSQSLLGVRVR
jgi:hypothetical protein